MNMKRVKITLFALLICLPLTVSVCLALSLKDIKLVTFLSLTAGLTAYSLMAINIFLATRMKVVEALCGGLDKTYFAHKYIGIAVACLLLFHFNFTANAGGLKAPGDIQSKAILTGNVAFWTAMAFIAVSFIKRFPKISNDLIKYHLWKIIHKLMPVVFLAATFHQQFVKVPFSSNSPAGEFLTGMISLGVFSVFFTWIAPYFRQRKYRVVKKTIIGEVSQLLIEPLDKPISNYRPGQFCFIRAVNKSNLKEPHPFTISGYTDTGQIQLCISSAGDFTNTVITSLNESDLVYIEGGYGNFSNKTCEANQIWIAGGIGITPFLSFLGELDHRSSQKVHLFYSVKDEENIIGLEKLKLANKKYENFNFTVNVSKKSGRLTAEKVHSIAGFDVEKTELFFCGPEGLRKSIIEGLNQLQSKPVRLHYEKFEFR